MVPYGDRYIGVAAKEHNKKRVLEVKADYRLSDEFKSIGNG
jgi:hypothetical protein